MSIKTRFALLLGLLLLGFISSWLVLRKLERIESEQVFEQARSERGQILRHWLDFSARALPQFAAEHERSKELELLRSETVSPETRARIANALESAGLQVLWMLRQNGTPSLEIRAPAEASAPSPEL